MSEQGLSYGKLSRERAFEKIAVHARAGIHLQSPRPTTKEDTARFFLRRGIDSRDVAERCRDHRAHVPFFENLVGATWRTTGTVSIVDNETGEESDVVKGHGVISTSTYQSCMEEACEARDRAVERGSLADFRSAVVDGSASLEAFVSMAAEKWNRRHPEDLLVDSKRNKVTFDDKLTLWIPKMTGGRMFNKSDSRWAHFKQLRSFRDDGVHPKKAGYGVELVKLAELINMFRMGIAGMHQELHRLFRARVPAVIINAFYMPDVEVVEVSTTVTK